MYCDLISGKVLRCKVQERLGKCIIMKIIMNTLKYFTEEYNRLNICINILNCVLFMQIKISACSL